MANTAERGVLEWRLGGQGAPTWAHGAGDHDFGILRDPSCGIDWWIHRRGNGVLESGFRCARGNKLFRFQPTAEDVKDAPTARVEWDGDGVRMSVNARAATEWPERWEPG